MLRIYPVVLEVLKQLQPALKRIEVKDRDLARQLRRCSFRAGARKSTMLAPTTTWRRNQSSRSPSACPCGRTLLKRAALTSARATMSRQCPSCPRLKPFAE